MIVALAAVLSGLPASVPPPAPRVASFASAPRTCAVLQAAYTAATRSPTPAYPVDVRSDARVLDLRAFAPDYRALLPLSAGELDDLAAEQGRYAVAGFRPACAWRGQPGPARDDEGHATFVTFTAPIFARAGRLAMVEVSFREAGRFGYGLICVARQTGVRWGAECRPSWIV